MLKYLTGAAAIAMVALATPAASGQAEPMVGQLTPTAATFCPRGWMDANGTLLPISQYDALFSLFGTTYGGDGRTTFGIPDLRGVMAGGQGDGPGLTMRVQGSRYGANTITLTTAQMPTHSHSFNASTSGPTQASIGNATLATFPVTRPAYAAGTNVNQALNPNAIYPAGGGFATEIQQPYNTVRWCVALYGVYPSRN